MAAMRRSCWKRNSSLESWSRVCEMTLPCTDSSTPSKALSRSWSMYRFSSSVVAVSAKRSAARSSLMRSKRFSLPSNIWFWNARPRIMRCTRRTADSCSSSSGSTSFLSRGESGLSSRLRTWNFLRPPDVVPVAPSPAFAASPPSEGCWRSFLILSMALLRAVVISSSLRSWWLVFAFLSMSLGCLSVARRTDGGSDCSSCKRPGKLAKSVGCTSILAVL
mmetsp:Transcript_28565/g.51739  ORF Transcript_28565/g.51739 Transcript_28565/m.51739 type:complete len:220 (+) Transcript_28565:599-1258(+)